MGLPQELRYLGDELLDALIGETMYLLFIIISVLNTSNSFFDWNSATLLRTLSKIEEVGLPQELRYLGNESLDALPCDVQIELIDGL